MNQGAVPPLAVRVRSLLGEAARSYQGRPAERRLADAAHWLNGPLRVALAGRVKAGKSTLLNALVGTRVAPTDAGECTRVITWYGHGREPVATAVPKGRPPVRLAIAKDDGQWSVALDGLAADDLACLDVRLPSGWLTAMTLVDTPGLGSLTESAGRRTQDFLGDTGSVDAVLYLMRHLHSSDVDFLDAFHDTDASETNPVNAIGVLSRADEVGGGDPQALANARRVAAGYRADPRVRGLVHTVLPMAGLLAETAATLTDDDFGCLAELASAGAPACAPLLLSATRFVAPFNAVGVAPQARAHLLDKLGIYGVRLSLDAIRSGTADTAGLAGVLRAHSGLDELRGLLMNQFAGRRDVLKADGALRLIDTVTREDPIPAAPRLRQAVERLRVGAHELAEIRLLTELRVGSVPGAPDQLAAMERLLGGGGTAVLTRLGLRRDAAPDDVRAVVTGLHAHWRRVAQNRLSDPALARAAQVLQRTCEGLAAVIDERRNAAPDERRPAEHVAVPQNGAGSSG